MEKGFLLKLAEAYLQYDASLIGDFLADDMHYASFWVYDELKSKKEYLAYLKGKLNTMKERGARMEFQLVPIQDRGRRNYALLVTNQKDAEDGNNGFVADFNPEGKVVMLNITPSSFF